MAILDDRRWQTLIDRNVGWYIDMEGTVRHTDIIQQSKVPWIYFLGKKARACTLYHNVYFETHGIIPAYCMEKCWKVCILPKSINDLFQVHDILATLGVPGKCGMDVRPITGQRYLGVMYAESMEEGFENLDLARKMIPFPSFLKKGCTEFENAIPSNVWDVSSLQQEKEAEIRSLVDHSWITDAVQPEFVQESIRRSWTQYAYQTADPRLGEDTPYYDQIRRSREPVKYER